MTRSSYDDDTFRKVVSASISIAGVLRKLGKVPAGGNYESTKARIRLLNVDTSHFKGQGHNKGQRCSRTRSLSEYLVKDRRVHSDWLRKRLIKEGVFPRKCGFCHHTEWLDRPIPLELDHKNGDRTDNRIENLRILCPNCHAFTPTYRGKNKRLVAAVGVEPTNPQV